MSKCSLKAAGTAEESFASTLLSAESDENANPDIKIVAGGVYSGEPDFLVLLRHMSPDHSFVGGADTVYSISLLSLDPCHAHAR